ncbi:MAG: DNA-processing protein DprA [Rhodothermales bacterium]
MNPLFDADLDERKALLALSQVKGLGTHRVRALLAVFGSAKAVLFATQAQLAAAANVGPHTAATIAAFDAWDDVDAQLDAAKAMGATLVTCWDDAYPEPLQRIYDPLLLFWYLGNLEALQHPSIAIVGTRRATDYGKRVAEELGEALAGHGYTIVSGLAYGIDTAAHRGALRGGQTVAVMGTGIDRVYPARNRELAHVIAQQGGLLTEYLPGTKPDAPNFPKRNRIISGLALGTIVVEAFEKGGALITARTALEQNREVFAVPGSIYSVASAGTHKLIREGHAKLVGTVADVLAEFPEYQQPATEHADATPRRDPAADLNGVERTLYEVITVDPLHIDMICEKASVDASTALVYLLSLEFKGLVRQLAGKQFYRVHA